ncbi:MAG: tetratricopeptide repeat protein [Planctomycetota bacterium]|nr:tetratricopeptide repeat protein [Planctomycetota bacterium]
MIAKSTRLPLAGLLLSLLAACAPDPAPGPGPSKPGETPEATPEPAANDAPAPQDERLGLAFTALAEGRLAACRELSEAVLLDHPGHPRAHFLLGMGLHKAKRYADARPHLEAARDATADFSGAEAVPYYLGWCLYYLGDYLPARASFEAHLATSDEGDSHFGLGVIAIELGELDAARTSLERALKIFEARVADGNLGAGADLAKTHARLADVALGEDDDEAARTHVLAALGINPDQPAVWFKLYQLALVAGDEAEARRALGEFEARKTRAEAGMAMDR